MLLHTARLALLLYAVSLALDWHGIRRASRLATTAGFVVFLAHVWLALWFHQLSHAAAYEYTRSQTLNATGFDSGAGLWANYAFVAAWAAVVARGWRRAALSRPDFALHGFLGFMAVNGAVVFAPSPSRYFGAATLVILVAATAGLGLVTRRRAG